jgi:hypothetical protein
MGFTIPTPPISFKSNNDNKMEHIEQHHFVKKSEKQAVNKHQPKEEPSQVQSQSSDVETITFHNTQPTSSYNPYTFQTETFNPGLEEAIANGKDSDLVAVSVGEIRKLHERIRVLEEEVMKSTRITSSTTSHKQKVLDAERARIEMNYETHKKLTELKKAEIMKQTELKRSEALQRMQSSKFDGLFDR